LERVVAPPALVAAQDFDRAEVEPEPRRLDHRLGKGRRVAEAQIEALPRDRMNAVRRVAEKRKARPHEVACERQPKRIGGARTVESDYPEPMPEAPLDLDQEHEVVAREELLGILRTLRPDERRTVPRERQDGERAARQKVLDGDPVMRTLVAHGRD